MTTFYIHVTKAEIKPAWHKFIVQRNMSNVRKSPDKTEAIIKLPEKIKKKSDIPEKYRPVFYKFWTQGKILNHEQAKALSKSWDPVE